MSPAELIAKIGELGGRLYLDEGALKLKAPKGALSEELRTELKEQKLAVIEFLTTAQLSSKKSATAITRADRDQMLPASFAQQRLWFLDELEPGTSTFNMSWSMRLRGPLDTDALQAAINDLCERHESLRTRFSTENAIPIQIIEPAVSLNIDYSADQSASDTAIANWLAATSAVPFDLNTAPLMRVHIRQTAADDHRLLIVIHHIVSDAWSMSILFHELGQFYAAHCHGEQATLPELPIQYADFSVWQRDWLQGPELDRQTNYWRKKLADAPPLLELPTDHPRPVVQTYVGSHVKAHTDTTLHTKLQALAQQHNASMFMLLQAALDIVLARYSGTEDIVIGTPIAGRQHAELEPLIGFFLNTLVMRTDISGNPSFTELLQQVRQTTLAAYDHQDLPFEKLVEELRPARELSHSPIFQVLFNLRAQTDGGVDLHGLSVEFDVIERNTAKVDLALSIDESKDGLALLFEYNTDLFATASIEELARAYINLLDSIAAQPDTPIGTLPLLDNTDTDLKQAAELDTRPATPFTEFPATALEQSITTRFETIVDAYGKLPAARSTTATWSYSELNAHANRVAHKLLDSYPGHQQRVGVLISQDVPMLAALLGVLKAGMAYVPLDPESPPARHRQICVDAGIKLIVTDGAHRKHAAEVAAKHIDVLEIDTLTVDTVSNPAVTIDPTAMAYVLFTSGSTGTPKGVIQSHQNVLHHCRTYTNSIHIDKSDRLSLLPPYGFDAAVMDIFGALLNGACLQIYDLRNEANPVAITQSIASNNVTVFHSTPTVFRFLLEADPNQNLSSVRLVVLGGEEARSTDFDLFQKIFPADAVFVNGLGPSESTLALQFFARHDTRLPGVVVPVGRSVDGTDIVLLDDTGSPTGIIGELAIISDYVTPGYWNEPQLTDAAFINIEHTGQKAYRTGDQARYLPDGQLVFMGRKDAQIKLRGHRIEAGEIEAVLLEHNDVQNCTVLLVKDKRGADQLVAYLTSSSTHSPDIDTLRQSLREKLPAYMVPSAYVVLDEIPLTANGKLDRSSMPLPDWEAEAEYVAPTTATEETLAAIWSDVLAIEKIGINDDFFALGGHSLLATQLIARVREQLDIEPTLRSIFETPTIAGFAASLETVGTNIAGTEITRCDRNSEIPQSFAQQRLWFLDQFEPGGTAYNLSQAVKLEGDLNLPALQNAIDRFEARHESVRTVFSDGATGPIQLIDDLVDISADILELPQTDNETIEAKITELVTTPFNLRAGPLLRIQLIKLAPDSHILVMTIHHIISDMWSLNILWQDLTRLYNAKLSGQQAILPDLPIQYADYSVWQQNWLTGTELERQLDYWRTQLSGAPAVSELPLDRPRPPQKTYRGDVVRWSLDSNSSESLRRIASEQGSTLFMVLLAAFNVLLRRYSGSDDIVVGSPIAGRRHKEFENLIGFFINTLVLRVNVGGNPTFSELLQHTRQATLDAYDHQDLPFEKLVEELQPARDMSHSPLFQVSFMLQNAPGKPAAFDGLEATALSITHGQSKFDLNLACSEHGGDISGLFEFNTDIFNKSTIERMGNHFVRLLGSIASNPDTRIYNLRLLDDAELKLQLHDWNNTKVEYPENSTIQLEFEAQVAKSPDATALICDGTQLTYSELNRRANQLAHYLGELGVRPDELVALCMDRGIDAVVSILAILKAGGAYTPLDPAYPAERLHFMLKDSGSRILLSDSSIQLDIKAPHCQRINLDFDLQKISTQSNANPISTTKGRNLAYAIYTSGSTGQPKGTLIENRSVLRLVINNYFVTLDKQVRMAMLAPISFDASTFELWGSLLHGGKCIVFPERTPGMTELHDFLSANEINCIFLTTTLFNTIIDTDADMLKGVSYILTGGEISSVSHIAKANQLLPETQLIHCYGPTESTTFTTTFKIPRPTPDWYSAPIGRPIANTSCYVLDNYMQAVPLGAAGQLYIGGDGLSRGYLNQPSITRENFVTNPFSHHHADYLYKTGDMVRYLPDGNIDFIGRTDDQVKVRGFRIELGEIEASLREHPAVNDAAVIVHKIADGDSRLVAYAANPSEGTLTNKELLNYLENRLPRYMVPSIVIPVDKIPHTANGKADRQSLPTPTWDSQQVYIAPQNPTEKLISAIWSKFLKIEKIGIHDDFFKLGGHSLLTIKLIQEIEAITGEQLTIADIFDNPTVQELSLLIPDKEWDLPEQKKDNPMKKLLRKFTRGAN